MVKSYHQFDLFDKKVFERAIVEPPFRFAAQFPNEACFYYMRVGRNRIITPSESFTHQTDEGLVLQCGNYFSDFLTSQDFAYCEAIAIHFDPEMLAQIFDHDLPDFLQDKEDLASIGHKTYPASTSLKSYIDSLTYYFDNPGVATPELLKVKLKELILLLAQTDNAQMVRTLLHAKIDPAVMDFQTVIAANVYNNLTLEELAALTNLSLSSFKREFAKHYDCSPARYFRQKKLEKAARLLRQSQLRISDIAFDCGFNDLAHFSKTFQKDHGLSPSEYRLNQIDKSLG